VAQAILSVQTIYLPSQKDCYFIKMPLQLAELFRYDAWANHRVLESLKQPNTPPKALSLFAHILAGQEVWLTRLGGLDSTQVQVWPNLTLAECEEGQRRNERALDQYLRTVSGEALEQPIDYRTTAGQQYRHTPCQILTHLALHGQHHRGQIASYLREAGITPLPTDLIALYREV
jgi:uncharacterized damage-inducible protein DinB